MKKLFTICALFMLTGTFAQTKFGALLDPGMLANANEHKVDVAKKLGIKIIRDRIVLTNPKDKPLLNTGFDVFMNINYGNVQDRSGEKSPVPFPTDLDNYKKLLTNAINSFKGKKPVVIAIENEEDNRIYHSGTPQDYLNELRAAIPIVHAAGIKVTNAGITWRSITYLVYSDLLDQGKRAEAQAYMKSTQMPLDNPGLAKKRQFAKETVAAYKDMDIDYVNFHWYSKSNDVSALKTTIEYLKRVTGKPVITNEIGQYDDSPETVKAIIRLCRQEQMPYVIWYSGLGRGPGKAVSLQDINGVLKPNGEAFKEAVAEQN
ncbi:hypothetical protein FC093_08020 [Ilyomonas limi]|uniref:Asl1-like glycosyl hydrolase catalytic domain-containing protein n=1 Tax=Ilyomonas limi TaxID=2575867 RepID=A0A4U3L2K5_9BACT|nr:glycosyl hydrolase [Ilyomonas limi]TKK69255.1 hypothetical protein FC093_08020 [Ilyomonas limi]